MKIFNLQSSIFNHLIHIDAYRLENGEELNKLGWQEMISDPNNLICIEWPERVAEIMPEHLKIKFEHTSGEGERKISLTVNV
jgi:tRNA A37 threonylcarbamoyladenosine biosynthesis protein TsaE